MIEKVSPQDAIKNRLIREALDLFSNSDLHPFSIAVVLIAGLREIESIKLVCKNHPEDLDTLIKVEQKIINAVAIIEEYSLD